MAGSQWWRRRPACIPTPSPRGVRELEGGNVPSWRVRKSGGGRKPATATDPGLAPALTALVDPATRGDPESPLVWTTNSTRNLAAALAAGRRAPEHREPPVAVSPRGDVVGRTAENVGVDGDLPGVDRHAEDADSAGLRRPGGSATGGSGPVASSAGTGGKTAVPSRWQATDVGPHQAVALRSCGAAGELHLVLAGKAVDQMLDTYAPERAVHVRDFIELSITLGEVVCVTDPARGGHWPVTRGAVFHYAPGAASAPRDSYVRPQPVPDGTGTCWPRTLGQRARSPASRGRVPSSPSRPRGLRNGRPAAAR